MKKLKYVTLCLVTLSLLFTAHSKTKREIEQDLDLPEEIEITENHEKAKQVKF
jgi:hypothetical protein